MQSGMELTLRRRRGVPRMIGNHTITGSLTAPPVRSAPHASCACAAQTFARLHALSRPHEPSRIADPARCPSRSRFPPPLLPTKPQPCLDLPAPPMRSAPPAGHTCAIQTARVLHTPGLALPAQQAVAQAQPALSLAPLIMARVAPFLTLL